MRNLSKRARNTLIVLLLVVFVVNFGYSLIYEIKPVVDASAYDRIGWNIAQGIGYVDNVNNANTPELDSSIGRVGPGFQFFLAGIYSVSGHSIPAVWFVHALLRVLTTLLVVAISLKLFKNHKHNETIALVSGFLFGLSPDLIVVQAMLLTETLGLFLIALSVWLSMLLFQRQTYWLILVTSLSFTLAIMTRPTTVLIFLIVVGVLFAKKLWPKALLLFIFPILIMTPWAVRNQRIYDHLVLTSSTGGYDLWVGNNEGALGGFDITEEIEEARGELHIIELDKIGFQKYFTFIAERPAKFIELQFRKTTMYFSLIRPTGFWHYLRDKPLEQVAVLGSSGLWTGLLLLSGIGGSVWLLFRRKDLEARAFLAFAIMQPIAVIPLIVESRYRYPLFPFLAVLGAFFLVELFTNRFARDRQIIKRIGLYTLLVLVLATGADALYNSSDIAMRVVGFL